MSQNSLFDNGLALLTNCLTNLFVKKIYALSMAEARVYRMLIGLDEFYCYITSWNSLLYEGRQNSLINEGYEAVATTTKVINGEYQLNRSCDATMTKVSFIMLMSSWNYHASFPAVTLARYCCRYCTQALITLNKSLHFGT